MSDMTGKRALEELVAGLDGVTPFEERDMMRYEYGGGRLAIIRDGQRELVADLYHEADREHFLRCSPDRIRAIAIDFAALEAEVKKLHASINAWCEQYDRANSEKLALETRAIAAEEGAKRLERYYAPEDASEVMVDAALAVNWEAEDERGIIHNVWHVMRAAIPAGNKDA